MSRIYFHSPSEQAEVAGSERAWMAITISDIFSALLPLKDDFSGHSANLIKAMFPPNHYVHTTRKEYFWESVRTALGVASTDLEIGGKKIDIFSCQLNTAMAIGSDALCLMARIHGQSEIHCFVEGEDRKWLSGIIQQGLDSGLMRDGQGWESTIEMLRRRSDEPVVLSYSVCDQFPNRMFVNLKDVPENFFEGMNEEQKETYIEDGDWYYDLPEEDRWKMAMPLLREQAKKKKLRLSPNNLRISFNQGVTAFELTRFAQERLNELEQEKIK